MCAQKLSFDYAHTLHTVRTDRGGCWFCPNAKLSELRHLYDHHPDLWQKMMRLQIVPGKVTEKFNRSQTFADIDAMFREWDLQTAA